ncbi:MAG TPA: NAD(P)H-binding protein [Pseudonocardia sp.]|uniref:NmrA family NAD(P)-binding protein n=1 Tax=Pseudonocardia sp. TaxID=60912 RepID=UPI002C677E2E|nr:NAD(P)H-binding protein [Pseudonocardia sp.]HTF53315.1 NAD(P)H-binding protein [Pseudonocardia sp.]
MSNAPAVLITGGTGTTGSRLATLLRGQAAVRVATRKPSDGAHVRFDWADPASHRPSVAGVDCIYLVAPVGVADPAPLVEPFLAAALRAGVRRVVLLSSSAIAEGAPSLGVLHRMVRTSVPEWAVLRPSWFMQNFLGEHPLAAGIRASGEIVTATGAGRVAFVDAADIAAVAARALLDRVPHNTAHVITGPEALSYADAAAIITESSGRTVRHRPVSTAELTARLIAAGIPAEFAEILAGLDADIRRGAEDRVTSTVRSVTGRPPRSFAEFVTAHQDAGGHAGSFAGLSCGSSSRSPKHPRTHTACSSGGRVGHIGPRRGGATRDRRP